MIPSLGLSLGRRPAPVFKGDIHIYSTWLFQYSSPRDLRSIFSRHNSKCFFGFKKKTSISLFISWCQDLRLPPLISYENTAPFDSAWACRRPPVTSEKPTLFFKTTAIFIRYRTLHWSLSRLWLFLKDDISKEIPPGYVVFKYLGFIPLSSWEFASLFANPKYLNTCS